MGRNGPLAARASAPARRGAALVLLTVVAFLAPAALAQVDCVFVVATPAGADDGPEQIFCSFSIDQWPAEGRPLERVAPQLYRGVFKLNAGIEVEYKFKREKNWESVEKDASSGELPNRRLVVPTGARRHVVLHAVAIWADQPNENKQVIEFSTPGGAGGTSPDGKVIPPSTRTGDLREHADVFSPQLNNKRTVIVYLPPSYERQKDRRFPVLYMQDGQNIFDAATSFIGVEWGLDETADALMVAGKMEEAIIVGVYNTPDRMSEYTPWKQDPHGGGDADKYLEFLTETVKPLIDKTYRTQPDREHTAIGGSSLGGLFSIYAAFKRPDVFGKAAVISPAVWWGDLAIVGFVRDHKPPQAPRLWIDMGTEEGVKNTRLEAFSKGVADCEKITEALRAHGYESPRDFVFETIAGGAHNEAAWAARADRVLVYLFPPTAGKR